MTVVDIGGHWWWCWQLSVSNTSNIYESFEKKMWLYRLYSLLLSRFSLSLIWERCTWTGCRDVHNQCAFFHVDIRYGWLQSMVLALLETNIDPPNDTGCWQPLWWILVGNQWLAAPTKPRPPNAAESGGSIFCALRRPVKRNIVGDLSPGCNCFCDWRLWNDWTI